MTYGTITYGSIPYGSTITELAPTCPTSQKYENDIIHLSAIPKDGIGPYNVKFIKTINGVPTIISSYGNALEKFKDGTTTLGIVTTNSLGKAIYQWYISPSATLGLHTIIASVGTPVQYTDSKTIEIKEAVAPSAGGGGAAIAVVGAVILAYLLTRK